MYMAVWTPGACYFVYRSFADKRWSEFPDACRLLLLTKELMSGDSGVKHRCICVPHDFFEDKGLKEIGNTYFGETHRVSRQGSFPHLLRK
ncbi:hypothetical protein P8452_11292 [Trifolium repens]|nr:hypothetical protein P8452_11292 [Trifolium repens]